ncbi:hypothetical protein AB0H87_12835, partial [Asanoa sp. NPDC050611]
MSRKDHAAHQSGEVVRAGDGNGNGHRAAGNGHRPAGKGKGDRVMVPPADFRSYYGRPVIKPPVWTHDVAAYLFTGGLAAGAALVAAGADLTGRPAAAGDVVGPVAELADGLADGLLGGLGDPALAG